MANTTVAVALVAAAPTPAIATLGRLIARAEMVPASRLRAFFCRFRAIWPLPGVKEPAARSRAAVLAEILAVGARRRFRAAG